MSRIRALPLVLLLTALLAGCHAPDDGGGAGGDGDGDGNGDGNGGGAESHAESVRLTTTPDAGIAAGADVEVCWQVQGRGTIPHTAVHWDNASHAGEDVDFSAYGLGVRYPDNATSADTNGYTVPGTFCTTFTMPDMDIYLIGHAFGAGEAPGVMSDEVHIAVEMQA